MFSTEIGLPDVDKYGLPLVMLAGCVCFLLMVLRKYDTSKDLTIKNLSDEIVSLKAQLKDSQQKLYDFLKEDRGEKHDS